MGKKQNSKFPAAKIKKIIQQNQDIGKLCNTIPPIIQRSLQLFLDQLCTSLNTIVSQYDLGKLTLPALKKAVQQSKYNFVKQMFDEVQDLQKNGNSSVVINKSAGGNNYKRPKKKNEDDDQYEQMKGRKMFKTQIEIQDD